MNRLTLYVAAAFIFAFAFTSCNKYEVSEPLELSSLGTALITGDMYAELDETNNPLESAPQGLTVTVTVPLSDYNSNNNSGGNHIVTTVTDANGKFAVRVPVISSGVRATISFESFTSTVIEEIGLTDTSKKTSLFELSSKTISGLGSSISRELFDLGSLEYRATSSDPNAGDFTPTTSIMYEGTLTYEIKVKRGVNQPDTALFEAIPAGTDILVTIVSENEFGDKEFHQIKTITTTAGGEFQIEVPMVKNGNASLKMKSKEMLQFENIIIDKRYIYIYNLNVTDNLYFIDYTDKEHKYSRDTFVKEVD